MDHEKNYPEPKVEKNNIEYAQILMQDYAGKVSEDTAIHLYSFQHFTASNAEFKKAIIKIAITEMKHLELLGKTIYLLGIKPEYKTFDSTTNNLIPWNSDNVNYETDFEKILKLNIASEKTAIKNYKYHSSIINDKYIKNLLARIIEDEEEHIRIFNSFLKRYF